MSRTYQGCRDTPEALREQERPESDGRTPHRHGTSAYGRVPRKRGRSLVVCLRRKVKCLTLSLRVFPVHERGPVCPPVSPRGVGSTPRFLTYDVGVGRPDLDTPTHLRRTDPSSDSGVVTGSGRVVGEVGGVGIRRLPSRRGRGGAVDPSLTRSPSLLHPSRRPQKRPSQGNRDREVSRDAET